MSVVITNQSYLRNYNDRGISCVISMPGALLSSERDRNKNGEVYLFPISRLSPLLTAFDIPIQLIKNVLPLQFCLYLLLPRKLLSSQRVSPISREHRFDAVLNSSFGPLVRHPPHFLPSSLYALHFFLPLRFSVLYLFNPPILLKFSRLSSTFSFLLSPPPPSPSFVQLSLQSIQYMPK